VTRSFVQVVLSNEGEGDGVLDVLAGERADAAMSVGADDTDSDKISLVGVLQHVVGVPHDCHPIQRAPRTTASIMISV
jgi:hypothetical protein